MREIKFRAWKEEDKEMFHFQWWQGRCHGNSKGNPEEYDRPIMQYTGLKDKNGKEIYEDDVIKYTTSDRIKANAILTCVVRWSIDRWSAFAVDSTYDEDFGRTLRESERLSVIGNVHENPLT